MELETGLGRQSEGDGRRKTRSLGLFDRCRITSICVTQHADTGIAVEHALEPVGRCGIAVSDDGHAGTHTSPAETMNGDQIGS